MSEEKKNSVLDDITSGEYKYGFFTDIETDKAPKGLFFLMPFI